MPLSAPPAPPVPSAPAVPSDAAGLDPALDRRAAFAVAVAREAAALAARWHGDPELSVHLKGPHDFVSAADSAVEALVADRVAAAFPEDGLLGEETGGVPADSLWVVDPIDGTANFVRGLPHFCVSLAFVRGGVVEIGVIAAPLLDRLYVARRGLGAALNGRPIRVSGCADVAEAAVEAGYSNRLPRARYVSLLADLFDAGCAVRRCGSGALGLAEVADGRSDAYVELHINSWDVLAGMLLVHEAGGWTNDFLAGDGLVSGNPILACPVSLRDTLGRITEIA